MFLNACESGREAAQLTRLGRFPQAFIRAGACAFVGTAWRVKSHEAALFAQAFYRALLDAKSLSAAAISARQAAKVTGDPTWLAYRVFGHPFARRA